MILKHCAAVRGTTSASLFLSLDDLVDYAVECVGVGEAGLSVDEEFARDDGLEVRAIFTEKLLDHFELEVGMVMLGMGLLLLLLLWHNIEALRRSVMRASLMVFWGLVCGFLGLVLIWGARVCRG